MRRHACVARPCGSWAAGQMNCSRLMIESAERWLLRLRILAACDCVRSRPVSRIPLILPDLEHVARAEVSRLPELRGARSDDAKGVRYGTRAPCAVASIRRACSASTYGRRSGRRSARCRRMLRALCRHARARHDRAAC